MSRRSKLRKTVIKAEAPPKKRPESAKMNSTNRRTSSDFLFAQPSILSGVARLIDFGVTFDAYNNSRTPQEADTKALASDWLSVGDDIAEALELFKRQEKSA